MATAVGADKRHYGGAMRLRTCVVLRVRLSEVIPSNSRGVWILLSNVSGRRRER